MARSVNDRLQDETIAHGLYVNRYGTGVARRMVSLLNRLDADLAAKLLVLLDGKRADTYLGCMGKAKYMHTVEAAPAKAGAPAARCSALMPPPAGAG